MRISEGKKITFYCRALSPFHTSRQEYANLIKCAPFILGSTFRGLVLESMILQNRCPYTNLLEKARVKEEVAKIHLQCEKSCPVQPFFKKPAEAFFSFGNFKEQILYESRTRIAIERNCNSASEGAIVTIESVPAGSEFEFSIILIKECLSSINAVIDAVSLSTRTNALGRLRSVGYGRFEVQTHQIIPFIEAVKDNKKNFGSAFSENDIEISFVTPLIISDGKRMFFSLSDNEKLSRELRDIIDASVSLVIDENYINPELTITDIRIKPEYVGRFSFETEQRENRLVAWKDSSLRLTFHNSRDLVSEMLAISSVLGIGEWNELGFGRFNFLRVNNDRK